MAFKHNFPSELAFETRLAKIEDRLDLYNSELSNIRIQLIVLHRMVINLNYPAQERINTDVK